MKILIISFILTVVSTTVLAKDCNSKSLNAEFERLSDNEGISIEARDYLMEMARNVKLTQILTCMGLNQVYLSADEAIFAFHELKKNKMKDLNKIHEDKVSLENLLMETDLDDYEKEIYTRALNLIPKRLQAVEDHHNALMLHLERSTR